MTSPIPQTSAFDVTRAAAAWAEFRQSKIYDLLAAVPLIGWFGLSAFQQAAQVVTGVQHAQSSALDSVIVIALLGKIAALVFVALLLALVFIRRPAKARAKGLLPRLSAFFGTYFGLALVWLQPQPPGLWLHLLSLMLMLGGLGFSVYAAFHLGRSFSVMAEARRLVIEGPYARIRHPLYLGEEIAMLGLTLQYLSAPALLILAMHFAFQLMRMKNEELVLAKEFSEYDGYKARSARLVPGLY
jgi:protein-S-isoprenylcysteine O-methyltransferase Ste14